jgi:N-acetylneuraminic acid mutarotase
MIDNDENAVKRRSRRTIAVYLTLLAALVLITIWASRFVLFQPWTAREWVNATTVAGNIYVFGGKDRAGQTYDEIYRIDLQDLRIYEVAELPAPRFGMGVAVVDHEAYLLGGFDGQQCSSEILVFDTRTKEVKKLAELPTPRAFGSVVKSGKRIFYLGGWDGAKPVADILGIEPETGSSRVLSRLPSPREFTAAASYGNKIYMFGGSDDRGTYLDDILEIDPDTGAVLRRTSLPSSRTRCSTVVVEEGIYVLGGWFGHKIDEVLFLDPTSAELQLELFASMKKGISDMAAVNLEGEIYLIGGAHERFQRQIRVQRWDPASGSTESLKFRTFLFW